MHLDDKCDQKINHKGPPKSTAGDPHTKPCRQAQRTQRLFMWGRSFRFAKTGLIRACTPDASPNKLADNPGDFRVWVNLPGNTGVNKIALKSEAYCNF